MKYEECIQLGQGRGRRSTAFDKKQLPFIGKLKRNTMLRIKNHKVDRGTYTHFMRKTYKDWGF